MKRLIITFAEGLDAAGATGAGVLSAVGHDAAVYRAPALHCFGYGKSELKCQIPQHNITNNTFVQADTSGQGRVVDAYILISTSKGQYLYDIRKIIGFSDPPPPRHCHTHATYQYCHPLLGYPPPPSLCGHHISIIPKGTVICQRYAKGALLQPEGSDCIYPWDSWP